MFRRLLREPLFHFSLIGAALFGLYALVAPQRSDEQAIVVSEAIVNDLAQRYAVAWQRPPTPDELQGLVNNWVRDELAYREGLALGLDRDDPVVRRRVRQKIDVLAEESVRAAPAGDAELTAFMRTHADNYAIPPSLSFEQVMLDPARHGKLIDAVLVRTRARLDAGSPPQALSDAKLLPAMLENTPLDLVARQFGDEFAASLLKLHAGSWQGPVRSSYGLHFVRLNAREAGRMPALDEVRTAVARDAEQARREQASRAYYTQLRQKYTVRFETGPAAKKETP